MFNKLHQLLIGTLTFLLLGCTEYVEPTPIKSTNSKGTICDTITNVSDIYGIWINTLNSQDTIHISEGFINRWDRLASGYFHFYKYQINSDSILINYTGLYKVGTPPYHRNIFINNSKDSILIQDFKSVYPGIDGDTFAKK
jgi:hypothetical protein